MKQEILFVDDDTAIRELLATYFGRKGYLTRTVATADEARLAVTKQLPDLIVLDVALEESDGLDLLESLRAGDPNLPIIMLTGMGFDPVLLNEARKRGANGYMGKGLPLDDLLMEVQRVLSATESKARGPRPAGGDA